MNEILRMIEKRMQQISHLEAYTESELTFLQTLRSKVKDEIEEQWHRSIDRMGEDA